MKMNTFQIKRTSLDIFLENLNVSKSSSNLPLFVQNICLIFDELQVLDKDREIFNDELHDALNRELIELSNSDEQQFTQKKSVLHESQTYNLLTQITLSNVAKEIQILCATFIYAQLFPSVFTQMRQNPAAPTNQDAMRRFTINLAKKPITFFEIGNQDIHQRSDVINTLKTIIENKDNITADTFKGAGLFQNINTCIDGFNEFMTVSVTDSRAKTKNISNKENSKSRTFNRIINTKNSRLSNESDYVDVMLHFKQSEITASAPTYEKIVTYVNTTLLSDNQLRKQANNHNAMLSNYPQEHQRVLINEEAIIFYNTFLDRFIKADSAESKIAIALMIFSLLLGIDVTWCDDIELVDNIDDVKSCSYNKIYISKSGYVKFRAIQLIDSYKANDKDKHWLKSTKKQIIVLNLPISLIPLLTELKEISSGGQLTLTNEAFNKEINRVRNTLGKRFTRNKLREFILNLYYRAASQDEIYATFLSYASPYIPASSCYYTPIPLHVLQNIHQQSLSDIFGELTPLAVDENTVYIGSTLCIDDEKIKNWLGDLVLKTEKCTHGKRSLNELIEAHNQYTLYVASVLLVMTGHRPCNDIFDTRNTFLLDENFAIISDKAIDKNHLFRVLPLCDVVISQVKEYQQHLKNLAERIYKFDDLTAQKIMGLLEPNSNQSLPFLCLLNSTNKENIKIIGINKTTIDKFWSENGMELPPNFYRHLLCNNLKKHGLNREKSNFVMGHFMAGQNILDRDSPINISEEIKDAIKRLNKIAQSLEIKAVGGLPCRKTDSNKTYEIIVPHFEKSKLMGYEARANVRKKNELKSKAVVDEYIDKNLPGFYSQTSKALNKKCIDKIKTFVFQTNNLKKNLVLLHFQKAINKRAFEAKRSPECRLFYGQLNSQSIFSMDFSLQLQQYNVALQSIKTNALDIICKSDHKTLFVDKLVSLFLLCLMIDLPYALSTLDFYTLLKSKFISFNDAQALDITLKKLGLRRYFPNSISMILISQLQKSMAKVSPSASLINKSINTQLKKLNKENALIPSSLTDIRKISKVGWLFSSSQAKEKMRKGIAFLPLPLDTRKLEENRSIK